MDKRRVLFACTHNSARSQMAEAMLNAWAGDRFQAFSAGTEATGIKPETVHVMEEIGLDLSGHRSKTIDEFRGQPFDWFVTVCDDAKESCPVLPGVRAEHWIIEDPSAATGTADQRLKAFRGARDTIRERLSAFVDAAGRENLGTAEPTVKA
jgi:arsenate reductase (thioredoxin)